MTLSLRQRISLTLAPLLVLLAIVGTAGVVLLYRLGDSASAILRENYVSVRAMQRLRESLERIDSSFQFALAGEVDKAQQQYETSWPGFIEHLKVEQDNVTVPGEAAFVKRLTELGDTYRTKGDAFFSGAPNDRHDAYFGKSGLLDIFNELKEQSGQVLNLNQSNMERASAAARETAVHSLVWFVVGLVLAILLALILAWHTVRAILSPIQSITAAATGISVGNLDQVVPYLARDELGQLAKAFNTMAHRLRDYRESHTARFLRVQRTGQATIDSFPDSVLVIDSEGRLDMANPAARHLLGVVPKRDGQPAAEWTPPDALVEPLNRAVRGEQDYLPEGFDKVIVLGRDGEERAVLPRILTIRDPYGATLGAAVVLQDVTRLRLLDQMKSDLVATASHELKTPLTTIRLAVYVLLEETTGPLTPKQTELLIDARDNCERLLEIVNNLLDLARLEQGMRQLQMRPESPNALLRAAVDGVLPQAQDKGIEVSLHVAPRLPSIQVDPERFGTALRNLLDNALTYTERGGRIDVSANAEDGQVVMTIRDTGIGIPPAHMPHVFDRFFRVPGQSRGAGTGLGLALVHEIVTVHRGTITCDSEPSRGTTFRIRLPYAPTDRLSHDVPPSTERSPAALPRDPHGVR